jgi:hypothetical protein
MISGSIRLEGFDARSWTQLVGLFAPPVVRDARPSPDRATGTLVLVVSRTGRVRKAFHSSRGPVPELSRTTYGDPGELVNLARLHRAYRVLVVREGALEEISDRIALRLHRDDDYLAQWLVVIRAVREALDAGHLQLYPRPFAGLPVPTAPMIHRALDAIVPEDTALVLATFDGDALVTAVALRRKHGEIDRVLGPDLLTRWTGALGGDWRRDHRVLTDAVAEHVAPVHLGLYAQHDDLRALLRNAQPGAWARAVATRALIVQPSPPYVAVALGADAVRAAAVRSSRMLAGIDALAPLAPFARLIRGRVSEIASVTSTLGFDPLKMLAAWLDRVDPEVESGYAPAPSGDADE